MEILKLEGQQDKSDVKQAQQCVKKNNKIELVNVSSEERKWPGLWPTPDVNVFRKKHCEQIAIITTGSRRV